MNRINTVLILLIVVGAGLYLTYGIRLFDERSILLSIRLPRLLAAVFMGMSLALSGLVFQTLLNNALADGYVLGLSSGASVGALLCVALVGSSWGNPWGSLVGALVSVALILVFLRRIRGGHLVTWVTLWGICLTLFFTSLTIFILQWMDPSSYYQASRWFMGSLNSIETQDVIIPAVVILFFSAAVLQGRHKIMALSAGPVFTSDLGLKYRTQFGLYLAFASVLTAGAVMLGGPVGFVGLVSPHVARRLRPAPMTTSQLFLRTMLVGILFLMMCDWIVRGILWQWSIPTGALTAAVGAPFLAWVLWRSRT